MSSSAPLTPAKGAEPAGFGATKGRAVNLGYSLKRIAINGLVDRLYRYYQRRAHSKSQLFAQVNGY
jgi:hypothetical protein